MSVHQLHRRKGKGPHRQTADASGSGCGRGLQPAHLPLYVCLAITIFAAAACGANSTTLPTISPSPTPTSRIELAPCNFAGDVIQIVTHGDKLEKYVQPVREALNLSIEYTAQTCDWRPVDQVCVHIFTDPDDFVEGLQVRAGIGETEAESYRRFFGTVSREMQGGADAMYINAGIIGVPELVARTAVHEYFHIFQGRLGGTMGGPQISFPTWFLEGMADWEMVKVMGVRYRNWLVLLQEDIERGRDAPLSSLVTWEQSIETRRQLGNAANPIAISSKAAAAIMFIEELAGPTAAAEILRGNRGGTLTTFGVLFQQVSGVPLEEFESRLREFVTEGR